MGVHGKGVSLAPFKALPFGKVGWAIASEDATMQRAAEGDVPGYMARTVLDLPPSATVFEIAGGRERLVIYCRTTSVSAAHATHCATYCTPCRPLI